MDTTRLYSIVFELVARRETSIPVTMGHLAHALFLNLIKQFAPTLSARLHDEPAYRPYTISPLIGGTTVGERITLRRGQACHLRMTLFDNGQLWRALQTHFLEAGPLYVHLGGAGFQLTRMLSTPHADPTGWVDSTDVQTLVKFPARTTLTMSFCSPTAFSLSNHQFRLLPEPLLVWESLLRVWNLYAPEQMRIAKPPLRECIEKHISVVSCTLDTAFLHFPTHAQKGFVGQCTYQLTADQPLIAHLTTLAAFAYYAGVGYKTTMGMGQVRVEFGSTLAG